MKKNVLALSIAAMIGGLGFAGVAAADVVTANDGATWTVGSAAVGTTPAVPGSLTDTTATTLRISDAGVGHNLLVPYFNAQNGNMSVFHVVNTDLDNGKAVKVRFRSASNSDDILDFQVFLSPGDVWTAAVTAGADGIAQITTADNSCTVPALAKNVPQKFVTNRLNPGLSDTDKANQTREGYVEIFNMADVPGPLTTGTATALYTAIKHVNSVAPCSVAGSAARTLLNNTATVNYGTESTAARAGFDTPTSGLLGDWYLINVPETTTFSGGATSVVALTAADGVAGRGNFVHFPQTSAPVDASFISLYTADPLFRSEALAATTTDDSAAYAATSVGTATVRAANYDLPDMSTPYATPAANVDAPLVQARLLTTALAATSVTNQYATDDIISAKTDWVFSMPTRRYSVVANYRATSGSGSTAATGLNSPNYRLFSVLNDGVSATNPDWFRPNNTSVDLVGNICVNADSQFFKNREEGPDVQGTEPVFSPGTPDQQAVFAFCGETSVLAFKDGARSVLGGNVARQTLTGGFQENGWGVITTANGGPGLPILGSAFIKLTNPNVGNGVSGNFGITWPHRFTRVVAPAVVAPTNP